MKNQAFFSFVNEEPSLEPDSVKRSIWFIKWVKPVLHLLKLEARRFNCLQTRP